MATLNPDAPPTPPTPPEDWECCGSECGEACIFEMYHREKAAYEQALRDYHTQSLPNKV